MAEQEQERSPEDIAAALAAAALAGEALGAAGRRAARNGGLSDADLDDYAGQARGQAEAQAAIVVATQAAVAAQWREFADWYDTTAIGRLVREQRRQLTAAKRQVAALTNAYLARTTSQTRGRRVNAPRLTDVEAVRLDVNTGQPQTLEQLLHTYGRPADRFRYLTSTGMDEADVLEEVVYRAEAIVEDEFMLTQRAQEREFIQNAPAVIVGYRRVIHPELSAKTGVCGLCIAASDRLYHKPNAKLGATERGDLREVHTGCNCTVLAVTEDDDPGDELNGRDLANLYAIAGSTYADDLIRTRFKITTHGELGPLLAYASQEPKLPAEVRRNQNTRRLPGEAPGAARRRNTRENAERAAADAAP